MQEWRADVWPAFFLTILLFSFSLTFFFLCFFRCCWLAYFLFFFSLLLFFVCLFLTFPPLRLKKKKDAQFSKWTGQREKERVEALLPQICFCPRFEFSRRVFIFCRINSSFFFLISGTVPLKNKQTNKQKEKNMKSSTRDRSNDYGLPHNVGVRGGREGSELFLRILSTRWSRCSTAVWLFKVASREPGKSFFFIWSSSASVS